MRTRSILLGAVLATLALSVTAHAVDVPDPQTPLQDREFFKSDLYISSQHVSLDAAALRAHVGGAVADRLTADYGPNLRVFMDPRSGALVNLVGRVPLIPGPGVGNDVTMEDVSAALRRSVPEMDPATVGDRVRVFVERQAGLIGVDVEQLGSTRAVKIHEQLWQISIPQEVDGIRVRHGRLGATISHGNLVLLGTETWGNVDVVTEPAITAEEALAAGFGHVGGRALEDRLWLNPTLEIVPFAPAATQTGDAFTGPVGSGYGHRLVWVFGFERGQQVEAWEVLVDAHSGEVLALEDKNEYAEAQITGSVYPMTSTEICPTPGTCGEMQSGYPMPFAYTGLPAPSDVTNSAGRFDYTSGTVTVNLQGPFLSINDNCGDILEEGAGNLDLGGTNGDHDCDSAGSSGNTSAARTSYYELSKLIEIARGWLPFNTWLQEQLIANVNRTNTTCNAGYSPQTGQISFYRAGSGCRNTGEIAAVFDHEWGHGLDYHDAGGEPSSSGEAYADIVAIYRLHDSCVGHGFRHTSDQGCGQTGDGTGFNANEAQTGETHCALDCSGVRDADWDRHVDHTPDTPLNFSCVSCFSGSGPCGRQSHCTSAPTRQAAWDLVARDLQAAPFSYDENTAFLVGNRLFYQGSGNVGSWHACSCSTGSDGCGAMNGYMQWLAADDDNGDLADGTPHMTAIHAAFDRHELACSSPAPIDGGCAGGPTAVPALVTEAGDNEVSLSWNAVPGAVTYRVFRTEGHAGCNFGKALIAEVPGLSFVDSEVANDRDYSYVVQAVGASPSCFSPASNCPTATPVNCSSSLVLDQEFLNCSSDASMVLLDPDLADLGSIQIGASSESETVAEVLTLTESPSGSGRFVGALMTTASAPVNGDGLVSVADGDTIAVTYVDALSCGLPDVVVDDTAAVDCQLPVITDVQAEVVGNTASLTWQTNEPADSRLVYDVVSPPSAGQAADPAFVTSHTVPIGDLEECTVYSYYVQSEDASSNLAVDTNGGQYYTFETGGDPTLVFASTGAAVPIPDLAPDGVSFPIAVGAGDTIQDLDVTVDIFHERTGDLVVSLIGPDGTTVVLADRRGGDGDHYQGTIFDDEAPTSIASGSAPFAGRFRPEGSLSVFDGKTLDGIWRLLVKDLQFGETGEITSWSLSPTVQRPCDLTAVTQLHWSSDIEMQWPPTPFADTYNVYRGTQATLPNLANGFLPDSCLELTVDLPASGPVLTDEPASGSLYWYLVRPTSVGAEGPVGDSSSGPRILNSSGACP